MDREPEKVIAWADIIRRWKFTRIIPCHFSNNIKASGDDFRRAFNFLDPSTAKVTKVVPRATDEDLALLSLLSNVFTKLGIVAESKVM